MQKYVAVVFLINCYLTQSTAYFGGLLLDMNIIIIIIIIIIMQPLQLDFDKSNYSIVIYNTMNIIISSVFLNRVNIFNIFCFGDYQQQLQY